MDCRSNAHDPLGPSDSRVGASHWVARFGYPLHPDGEGLGEGYESIFDKRGSKLLFFAELN